MREGRTFTVVGTSIRDGVEKIRLADGITANRRASYLRSQGDESVILHDLPRPMGKDEAVAWLHAHRGTAPVQAAPERPVEASQAEPDPLALWQELQKLFLTEDGKLRETA
jgi:hypothetical protein